MKIAVIGAGSTYMPELFSGVLDSVEAGRLPVSEFVLEDIDRSRLDIMEPFCERMMKKRGLYFTVRTTMDLSEAIEGASFVLTQLRVGGNRARHEDELLARRHGLIGQETTGIGGFAKALRTVPVIRSVADIMQEKAPDAWLLNFTNPVSIVTQALVDRYPDLKWIGLCNYPYNVRRDICAQLGIDDGKRLFLDYVGLNHLSFVSRVRLDGKDVTQRVLDEQTKLSRMKNIPDDEFTAYLLETVKLIPSPYLHYYWNSEAILREQLAGKKTRAEAVAEVEAELIELYKNKDLNEKPAALEQRGGAYYSTVAINLMESLNLGRGDIQIVNARNGGAIEDLEDDASVEVNCVIDRAGAHPIASGHLPESVRSLVRTVKAYERYAARAAWNGSYEEAFLALLQHPLCQDAGRIERALDDLIATNRPFLKGFEKGKCS